MRVMVISLVGYTHDGPTREARGIFERRAER
jgi:hypothetical protein